MIVDLVRNDLAGCASGASVHVPALLAVEPHPGLVHLVSTVEGRLRPGLGWADAIDATFPPGSVTGAPKLAALDHIARLEPVDRGVYCGAVGWVDADRRQGELNVAIRTFWIEDGALHFGTGGGITWDSSPAGRVGRDRAEGPPAAACRVEPAGRRGSIERMADRPTMVWVDGGLVALDQAAVSPSRPRRHRRRRHLRDASRSCGACRSPPGATWPGCAARPPASRLDRPARRRRSCAGP